MEIQQEDEKILAQLERTRNLNRILPGALDDAGPRCWSYAIITVLNQLWLAPQSDSSRDGASLPWASHTASVKANQIQSLRMIEQDVDEFLLDKDDQKIMVEKTDLRTKQFSGLA